ncbi:FAD-dependent oxidoreductase [Peribacillus frigoritolerans]|nr:FAD-dependent oxidoreductase [Peribacillus frigoritolerans]
MKLKNIQCWKSIFHVMFGSSGAHCAYFLAETGLNVVLIDKQDISEGSTVAYTGLLQYSNDKTLTSLIHSIGEEAGTRHVQLCLDAIRHF